MLTDLITSTKIVQNCLCSLKNNCCCDNSSDVDLHNILHEHPYSSCKSSCLNKIGAPELVNQDHNYSKSMVNVKYEQNSTRILFWNVAGKVRFLDSLSADAYGISFLENFDVVCLSETWCLNPLSSIRQKNFHTVKGTKTVGRPSGGFEIYSPPV